MAKFVEGLCVSPQDAGSLPAQDAGDFPCQIGPFRVLGRIGEGGFGTVYLVQCEGVSEAIALKVLRNFQLATAASIAKFRREPTLSAKLDPRYVVRVLDSGELRGAPYFTMEYMAGGTLRARMAKYRGDPVAAAELMIQIAEAVEYLHHDPTRADRAAILHCDLKPENILFGKNDDRPRISDFGIAKLANDSTWASTGSRPVGCPQYMAPEQLCSPARRNLTAAADVYSLGAILYELLTGYPPFSGTDAEILHQLREEEPLPPRRVVPNLDRFLENVVLNALEKDPARRYRSAAAFANALARAVQKLPDDNPLPSTLRVQLQTWARRSPLVSSALLWAVLLVVLLGFSVRSTLLSKAQALEADQQINASIASMEAVAVNLQLLDFQHRIAELARDEAVIDLLQSLPTFDSSDLCIPAKLLLEHMASYDTMFVMGLDGRQIARSSPKSREYLARTFDFRDYFRGARKLGERECPAGGNSRSGHLARAYTSESDGSFEFAVSAPLCRNHVLVGVLGGTIATDKVLGAVRLLDDHRGRVAAVLGPRDRDRPGALGPLPEDLTFIVHPGLIHGQAVKQEQPAPEVIRSALGISVDGEGNANSGELRYATPYRIDNYRDPVPGFEGVWAATIAAADQTGYLVAVQSRLDVSFVTYFPWPTFALSAVIACLLALAAVGLAGRRT